VRYTEPDLAKVLAPPYDIISPAYRAELYERHPHNVIRIILNRAEGDAAYREAAQAYRSWLSEGTLAPDERPALYLLEQVFEVEGSSFVRWGLLARFRTDEDTLPHEKTRTGAKEDRLRLLEATRANFSPIFLFFSDSSRHFRELIALVASEPAALTYADDGGVRHRLWRVDEPERIARLQHAVAGRAYIADGHHRYAAALRYKEAVGPEGGWTFGYFTPMESPGLKVLPYHRLLSEGPSVSEAGRALRPWFRVRRVDGPSLAAQAVAGSQAPWAFGLAEVGGDALVAEALSEAQTFTASSVPCLRALDTHFLHTVALTKILAIGDEAVGYAHSLGDVEEALKDRACRLAVLMRPTPVGQIVAVAEAGESMPPKSTFFYPKIPSGLVIHPLP